MTLTHNLIVLLRNRLASDEGIREEKVERKRGEAMEIRAARARPKGRKVAYIHGLMPVAVQLTAQLIRALRNGIIVSGKPATCRRRRAGRRELGRLPRWARQLDALDGGAVSAPV